MTSITRQQTQTDLRDRSIPVQALRDDQNIPARMRDRMVGADMNGDGQVSGAREVDRLFRAVDHFDRDGSRNSLGGGARGAPSPAPAAMGCAISHARPARGLGNEVRPNPLTPADARPPMPRPADSRPPTPRPADARPPTPSTQSTRSTTGPARPATNGTTSPGGQGLNTNFRQFREVDVNRLRAAMPPQARHLAQSFVDAGRRHNIDPLVLASISRHETGGWTSNAFRNRNNAMGISGARGPRTMASHEASVDQMARSLANPRGHYRNANTVREMWGVYAPGPATGQRQVQNDPRNLNRHWGPGIARALSDLERAVR